jgi:cellulose synthase/poly-beta-1,6-N-acetylglucosamine synthase-like glycosyltransferase
MDVLEIAYVVVCGLMLVVTLFLYGYTIHAFWLARRPPVRAEGRDLPAIALVIPCRGLDPDLAENLRRHFHHDYPRYRILFTIGEAGDPAGPVIEALIRSEKTRTATLVVAPRSPSCVDKVSNQLAAFRCLDAADEVVVCADSDGMPRDAGWLRELVAGLDRATLVSGFRWYFPERGSFTGQVQSAWDATWFLLHALGKTVWGGAMAFRRDTYQRLQYERHLETAVTDDLVLQACTHRAGEWTGFVPGAMMMSEAATHFGDFYRWAVRQSQLVRMVTPAIWLMGFATANINAAFFGLSAVLLCMPGTMGWALPATALGAVALSYGLRGFLSYRLVCRLFAGRPEKTAALRWTYYWATPLTDLLGPVVAYTSLFTRTIRWRGISYRVEAGRVVRLS